MRAGEPVILWVSDPVQPDVIVEHCKLDHPAGTISSDKDVSGVLFRENDFGAAEPRYSGRSALIVQEAKK